MPGLDATLTAADQAVAGRLASNSRYWAFRDPEVRRVLGRLSQRLGQVRRFSEGRTGPEADEVIELLGMLKGDQLDRLDLLWAVHDRLGQIVMRWASPEYLAVRIAAEQLRPEFESGPPGSWSPSVRAILERASSSGMPLSAEVEREAWSFREEVHAAKILHRQAQGRTRSHILLRFAPVIAALTVAFGLAIVAATDLGGKTLAATAIAGAVGALLAGIRQVRDVAKGLGVLRSSRAVVIVQPLIGASLAMLVALALDAGLLGVELPGDTAKASVVLVTYGFIAGFSEPFAVGVIGRVTGGDVPAK